MERMKTNSAGPNDEPEEGEIVSDDLEDISDESIIFSLSYGKSLSRSDQLQALSLSSISDTEENIDREPRKKKKRICKRHVSRRKKIKRKRVVSESSDEDMGLTDALKNQLKAAVRVDIDDAQRNSLRSRLFPINGQNDSDHSNTDSRGEIVIVSDEKNAIEEPKIIQLSGGESPLNNNIGDEPINIDCHKQEDEYDTELRELRLEALKTALNNKFGKKRRKKDEDKENTDHTNEETKSNKTDSGDIQIDTPTVGINNQDPNDTPTSPEEDEDVLRALLLASMSKKMVKTDSERQQNDLVKVRANVTDKLNKVLTNGTNNLNTKKIPIPLMNVKPLIIKLGSESESDTDYLNSPEKTSQPTLSENGVETIPSNDKFESSIEKFLQEQRAKVESQMKVNQLEHAKKILKEDVPKINNIIENNTNAVVNGQKPNLGVKRNVQTQKNSTLGKLNESLLNAMPENKRREYKKLKLILRKAEVSRISSRLRKAADSNKITVMKQNNSETNKILSENPSVKVVTKPTVLSKNLQSEVITASTIVSSVLKTASKNQIINAQAKKWDGAVLQATLNAMQVRKDGRLQMQDKYKGLRPLLKKINDISKEQTDWNHREKNLLELLTEAKKKQAELRNILASSIRDLFSNKTKIDRSVSAKTPVNCITSTPLKPRAVQKPTVPGANSNSEPTESNVTNISNDKHCDIAKQQPLNVDSITCLNTGNEAIVEDINIVDPNDVDDVIKQTEVQIAELKNTIEQKNEKVKYVSPLDSVQRKQTLDPYLEMCPYEVYGTCKDAECVYQHLPK